MTRWSERRIRCVDAAAYSTLSWLHLGSVWQTGITHGANRVLVYQYLITLSGSPPGENLETDQLIGAAIIFCGVSSADASKKDGSQ